MGTMQPESAFSSLLAAAAFLKRPVQDLVSRSISEAYEQLKSYLSRKFGEGSGAMKALEFATAKPESQIRKALLVEECASVDLTNDPELARLVSELAGLLPAPTNVKQNVRVSGRGNHVQVV